MPWYHKKIQSRINGSIWKIRAEWMKIHVRQRVRNQRPLSSDPHKSPNQLVWARLFQETRTESEKRARGGENGEDGGDGEGNEREKDEVPKQVTRVGP